MAHSPAVAAASVIFISDSDSDDWSEKFEELCEVKIKRERFLPEGFLDPLQPSKPSKCPKLPVKKNNLEHFLWDDTKKEFLLQLLEDHNEPKWRPDKFTRSAWERINQAFNERFPDANVSKTQLQDQISHLKKIYKVLKQLSEVDGLSWDFQNSMLRGQEDALQKLLLTNKDVKKWYKKPWPYFSTFQKLFEGKSVDEKQSNFAENNIERVKTCHQANRLQEIEEVGESIVNSPSTSAPLRNRPLHFSALKQRRHSQQLPDEKDFSIKTCMEAFYRLDGFMKKDLYSIGKVFKSSENREIFLSLREEDREVWLREEVDKV